MPLSEFIRYAQERGKKSAVDTYGVTLLKSNVFTIGARPVIYGMTFDEIKQVQGPYFFNQRLPPEEQYRYILSDIDKTHDWLHEREWRWANWKNDTTLDGLPVWKIGQMLLYGNDNFRYGKAGVIVKTAAEKDEMVSILLANYGAEKKRVRDDEEDPDVERLFFTELIEHTFIIVLDEIGDLLAKGTRVEDVVKVQRVYPMSSIVREKYPL
jgi:hypothetical protein